MIHQFVNEPKAPNDNERNHILKCQHCQWRVAVTARYQDVPSETLTDGELDNSIIGTKRHPWMTWTLALAAAVAIIAFIWSEVERRDLGAKNVQFVDANRGLVNANDGLEKANRGLVVAQDGLVAANAQSIKVLDSVRSELTGIIANNEKKLKENKEKHEKTLVALKDLEKRSQKLDADILAVR